MRQQGADERADHLAMGPIARVHGEVGLRVDGLAQRQQALDLERGIGGAHQGAVVAPHDALRQGRVIGPEPDGDSRLGDRLPGARIHERPPARRQHARAFAEEAGNHPALPVAKIGLAMPIEDFRDGHAGGHLDLGVRIHERQAELRRETLADRSLARSHHADERDDAPPEGRA